MHRAIKSFLGIGDRENHRDYLAETQGEYESLKFMAKTAKTPEEKRLYENLMQNHAEKLMSSNNVPKKKKIKYSTSKTVDSDNQPTTQTYSDLKNGIW